MWIMFFVLIEPFSKFLRMSNLFRYFLLKYYITKQFRSIFQYLTGNPLYFSFLLLPRRLFHHLHVPKCFNKLIDMFLLKANTKHRETIIIFLVPRSRRVTAKVFNLTFMDGHLKFTWWFSIKFFIVPFSNFQSD